ncbi:MAG: oligoendopeptidase F [Treponemataceae bacterium]
MKLQTPTRKEVASCDTWDLSTLYKTPADWDNDLRKLSSLCAAITKLQGTLSKKENLLCALQNLEVLNKTIESLGNYAFLLTTEDEGNTENQSRQGKYVIEVTQISASLSFLEPEIQSIPSDRIQSWIKEADFADYSIWLSKLIRAKPYILSEKEERLIALQGHANETAHKAFGMLTNVDLQYGVIKTKQGEHPITQSSWSVFMESSDRQTRKDAYTQFYHAFDTHKNTIASLYAGSVNLDVYHAQARGYESSRHMALFPDNVPLSVYDNLITTVRNNLAPLHKYYSLRKKILKLDELRHYDVYVPLVESVKKTTSFDAAVEILRTSLSPLGKDYTDTLCHGLLNGWCDKYENKGKHSGAFSSGAFTGYPYILMNYKQDVLRDDFTLAHEGGHSMHSWHSSRANPFMHYDYTIFEAEVASTFNEELLFRFMLENEKDQNVKNYLLCNRASDILATLYRQTMFAEYELKTHQLVESGIPLTVDECRKIYRELLASYFGEEMIFEEQSDLECLRIPHFYRAFYVYKYATGISASLALAERVLSGGAKEKDDYFAFLKSGGSRFPIEALKVAGVDMNSTKPIEQAIGVFSRLVDNIESSLL